MVNAVDPLGLDYWIEDNPAAGFGLHQRICVGNYYNSNYFRSCLSFGILDEEIKTCDATLTCNGTIYFDSLNKGKIVNGSYMVTSEDIDRKIFKLFHDKSGRKGEYNLLFKNCRHFSKNLWHIFNQKWPKK